MEFFENEQGEQTPRRQTGFVVNKSKCFAITYTIMAIGLLLTFGCALLSSIVFPQIFYNVTVIIALSVAELATALVFSFMLNKMNAFTAYVLFFLYAALTGITLGSVFLLLDMQTIYICFIVTAVLFAAMAIFGHFTKWDLTSKWKYLVFCLIGIVIVSIVGVIFRIRFLELFVCCAGILLFLVITAFDTQKLSRMYDEGSYVFGDQKQMYAKYSIFTAFQLYLDFINIFYYLIRIILIMQNDR